MKRTASASTTSTDDAHPAKRARPSGDHTIAPQLLTLLTHTPVESFWTTSGSKIFVCQRTDKMVDVWKGLVEHNFLSVPVLQKTKSKYYGFVDLADIVTYVIGKFSQAQLTTVETWEQLMAVGEDLRSVTIGDIMSSPLTRRNPFHPVTAGYSLFTAFELLARERGLHRVPVISNCDERRLVNIITQSQVLRYIDEHKELLGSKATQTIATLPFEKTVISVSAEQQTIEAFNIMLKHHVTGIAVVDKDGKITGNLSLRDLKGIQHDGRVFWRLFQPVSTFLQQVSEQFHAKHGRPMELVSVLPTESLGVAIERMTHNHVHRIWVVDQSQHAVGVLSIKDVLLEIIESPVALTTVESSQ